MNVVAVALERADTAFAGAREIKLFGEAQNT